MPLEIAAQGGYAIGVKEILFELEVPAVELAAQPDILQDIENILIPIDTSEVTEDTSIELMPTAPQGAYLVSPSSVVLRMIVVTEP